MNGSRQEAMLGTNFTIHLLKHRTIKKSKEGKHHGGNSPPQDTMMNKGGHILGNFVLHLKETLQGLKSLLGEGFDEDVDFNE